MQIHQCIKLEKLLFCWYMEATLALWPRKKKKERKKENHPGILSTTRAQHLKCLFHSVLHQAQMHNKTWTSDCIHHRLECMVKCSICVLGFSIKLQSNAFILVKHCVIQQMLFQLQNQSAETILQDAFQNHQSHISTTAFEKRQNLWKHSKIALYVNCILSFLLNYLLDEFKTKFCVYTHRPINYQQHNVQNHEEPG